jgi:hypothetical protein
VLLKSDLDVQQTQLVSYTQLLQLPGKESQDETLVFFVLSDKDDLGKKFYCIIVARSTLTRIVKTGVYATTFEQR